MATEENKYAFRVHIILLDVFNKLVYVAIEQKIEDNGFSMNDFLIFDLTNLWH